MPTPPPAPPPTPAPPGAPSVDPTALANAPDASWDDIITAVAQQHQVDPRLARAVAKTESWDPKLGTYNPAAVSKAGAVGIFQLMPATAARWKADPRNPYQNINAGVQELAQLLGENGNDVDTALRRYNASPDAPAHVTDPYLQRFYKNLADISREPTPPPPRATAAPATTPPWAAGATSIHAPTWNERHPWLNAMAQAMDPNEAQGRRNIAGMIGGALGGLAGIESGPGAIATSAGGAGLFAGLEQRYIEDTGLGQKLADWLPGKTDVAEPPPDPNESAWWRAAKAGGEQALYDIGGRLLLMPVRWAGKSLLSGPVSRAATAYYESGKTAALDQLYKALDSLRAAKATAGAQAAEAGRGVSAAGAAKVAAAKAAGQENVQAARLAVNEALGAVQTGAGAGVEDAQAAARAAASASATQRAAARATAQQTGREAIDAAQAAAAAEQAGVKQTGREAIDAARREAEAAEEAMRQQYQERLIATRPSEAGAGRAVAATFEGPGRTARGIVGQVVSDAAQSGPDISLKDIKQEASRIVREELLPPEQKTGFPRFPPPDAEQAPLKEIAGEVGAPPPRGPSQPWGATGSNASELFQEVFEDAQHNGFAGTKSELRPAFDAAQEAADSQLDAAADALRKHGPAALLQRISEAGGIGPDAAHAGEINDLWQSRGSNWKGHSGDLGGVPGVLKSTGQPLDEIVKRITQDGSYPEIKTPRDLLDAVDRAVTTITKGTALDLVPTRAAALHGLGVQPGTQWWKDFLPSPVEQVGHELTALERQALMKHPAMGVIGRIVNAPDTVDFATAHLYKSQLQRAIEGSYDDVVKSQATNITQHLAGQLRDALSVHPPYNEATRAYADVAKLFTKGHAPLIKEVAIDGPERIVRAISVDDPTPAAMLRRVLTEQAEVGGGKEMGQQALQSVQEAWVHRNVLDGPLDTLVDRVGALKGRGEFLDAFGLNTPAWRETLDNAQALGAALKQTQAAGAASVAAAKGAARTAGEQAAARGEQAVSAVRGQHLAARAAASEAERAAVASEQEAARLAEQQATERGARAVREAREAGARQLRAARATGQQGVAAAQAQSAAALEAQKQAASAESLGYGQRVRETGAAIRAARAGTPEAQAFAESRLSPTSRGRARTGSSYALEYAARAALATAGFHAFGPAGIALGALMRGPVQPTDAELIRYVVHSNALTRAVVRGLFSPGAKAAWNAAGSTVVKGLVGEPPPEPPPPQP